MRNTTTKINGYLKTTLKAVVGFFLTLDATVLLNILSSILQVLQAVR